VGVDEYAQLQRWSIGSNWFEVRTAVLGVVAAEPNTWDAVGEDGLIADPQIRRLITDVLHVLQRYVQS
jgi:hypothetical protein